MQKVDQDVVVMYTLVKIFYSNLFWTIIKVKRAEGFEGFEGFEFWGLWGF